PEDRRDVVGRLQEVLGRLEVDLLTGLRAGLERLPHEIVEFGERLQVLRLEVIAPEDSNLVLGDLRVLLFRRDITREFVCVLLTLVRRGTGSGLLELVDQVDRSEEHTSELQ